MKKKTISVIMLILLFVALFFLLTFVIQQANISLPDAILITTASFIAAAILCAIICFISNLLTGD